MIKSLFKNIRNFFYEKLFKINDSPQKISLGFGLGIFCGMLPGTGPLAALFLAVLFRVNRASALLASLITNTWVSLVTFVFSIKVGSAILGLDWRLVYNEARQELANFTWQALFRGAVLNIAFPIVLGYLILSFALGFISYLLILIILKLIKR